MRTRGAARGLLAIALACTMGLGACGARSPFSDQAARDANTPAGTTPTLAAPLGATAPTTPDAPQATPATPPQQPLPTTPAQAPAPAGTTAAIGSARSGPRPKTRAARIAADKTAMLNVRTMVSVIEGCHSGRPSYRDCDTQSELGSPSILGVEIGTKQGQVRITASKHGFRMTGHSRSGAKFTVARGPNGDRFKCIQGRRPGACPPDHIWSW